MEEITVMDLKIENELKVTIQFNAISNGSIENIPIFY